MRDTPEFRALFDQNQSILDRHGQRHDLSWTREIEITTRFKDRETARNARAYVLDAYPEAEGVLFRVQSFKYSEDDTTIQLAFSIEAIPDAEIITTYEFMLQDAAARFGGDTPGWEMSATPSKA